ncbi:unnamed protein product [Tilletia controversa]|uniref:Major facilitator superfamily (MFS) profile domain-containing protein n=1 Tax=Tilletia controversa TaxID=13291 RepID=A0A8X7MXY1_9BASI|nr:hypothetical protein CF328_g319 [Tilletia controversa]KAE8253695.1 hypothetical protein A4X06_0g1278 [Tilletia controversa]CAD6899612.1 unnamed protein product [Tilletia controversa]CAD6902236.1 unnamed protein product [Tilletia controversa]CAD6907715.1 unnamed protein product [Tilletia controversa]
MSPSSSRTTSRSASDASSQPAASGAAAAAAHSSPAPEDGAALEKRLRDDLARYASRPHEDPDLERTDGAPPDRALEKEEARLESAGDVIWVDFEEGDTDDPFQWSTRKKWFNACMTCIFTVEVASAASTYVSGIAQMERDLGVEKHVVSILGISLYALGFSLPPLVLAPFSEALGRKTIYVITHFLWGMLFLGVGFAQNIETVLILRFLQGAFGSTGSTMVGGTISDLFRTAERGIPMALFAVAGIGATGLGPAWAGWTTQYLSWRWVQWISAAASSAFFVVFALTVSESRGSVLLARRAAKLRKQTGDPRYRARAEEERASMAVLIKTSLTRPLWLLVSEPVVAAFSIWIAFAWGIMYALLESIGLVTALHDFSLGQTGLVFLTLTVASVLGFLTNFYQEALYRRHFPEKGPEARLYAACAGAVLFPVGCLIYAWTSYAHVSMAGPIVGIIVLMLGVYHIYLSVFSYLADCYLIYASSALAAQSFARNVFAFAFPLFVTQMYHNLGYQWASTLVALLGAVLGVVPFVLFRWGHRIRARSRFSQSLQKEEDARREKAAALEKKGDV